MKIKEILQNVSAVLDTVDLPGIYDNLIHTAIDLIVSLIPEPMPGEEKHKEVVKELVESQGASPADAAMVTQLVYKAIKKEQPDWFDGPSFGQEPH